MMSWLNHIRSASEKIYNELPQSTPQENSNSTDLISQASTLTILQSEENLKRIREIQARSPNCADCNTPSKFLNNFYFTHSLTF